MKRPHSYFLFLILLLIFSSSCSKEVYLSKKNFSGEHGIIKVKEYKETQHLDSITFYGKFTDIETGKPPEASCVIIVDSTAHLLSKEGTYSLTLKYKDSYELKAFTSPYYAITTGNVKVKKGKKYQVDFLLKKDTNPIID
jgi:hypothetical protein